MADASSLLKLPGEILNLIYEFSLTSVDGLVYRTLNTRESHKKIHLVDATLHCPDVHNPAEFNQMKYVSKKFYEETNHLELNYNTVIFNDRDPVAHFLEFRKHMPRSIDSFLRRIRLQPPASQNAHLWENAAASNRRDLVHTLEVPHSTKTWTDLPHLQIEYTFPALTAWWPRSQAGGRIFKPLMYFEAAAFVTALLGREFPSKCIHARWVAEASHLARLYIGRGQTVAMRYQVPRFKVWAVKEGQDSFEQGAREFGAKTLQHLSSQCGFENPEHLVQYWMQCHEKWQLDGI
jgi:hypothetical protein